VNKFDADTDRLQRFLFFSVAVAGKQAEAVKKKVDLLAGHLRTHYAQEAFMGNLSAALDHSQFINRLKEVRFGQYTKMLNFSQAFMAWPVDLTTATVADLRKYPGVGPKTARFFILYTRPGERLAVLDTHILAWMKEQGVAGVPKSTPQSESVYTKFERIFLDMCDKRKKTPHQLDDEIWNSRTRSFKKKG